MVYHFEFYLQNTTDKVGDKQENKAIKFTNPEVSKMTK